MFEYILKQKIYILRFLLDRKWYKSCIYEYKFSMYIKLTCLHTLSFCSIFQPYFTIVAVIVYILPTIVIVVCYSGICIVVWQKWKESFKLTELNSKISIIARSR